MNQVLSCEIPSLLDEPAILPVISFLIIFVAGVFVIELIVSGRFGTLFAPFAPLLPKGHPRKKLWMCLFLLLVIPLGGVVLADQLISERCGELSAALGIPELLPTAVLLLCLTLGVLVSLWFAVRNIEWVDRHQVHGWILSIALFMTTLTLWLAVLSWPLWAQVWLPVALTVISSYFGFKPRQQACRECKKQDDPGDTGAQSY